MENIVSYMDSVVMEMGKIQCKQIEEFAAAFIKKVGLDPEEIVMFQGVEHVNNKIFQKTFFAKKNSEEVKIIEELRNDIKALEKRLKIYEEKEAEHERY